jgi:tetratricopeptide (TPR) repeat protein
VALDSCLRPETNVTAYATLAVKAQKAERVAVRVGSSGAVKVWVNGRLALDHDVYRPVRIDQDAGGAWLEAGWNRVTIKLSAGEAGGFAFFARLTRPDGGRLDGVSFSAEPADLVAAAGRKPNPATVAVADLGRELGAFAKTHAKDAQALTDWGIYQHYLAPEDPERHLAAEALQHAARLRPSPEAFGRLAQAQLDPNDQRKSLETALGLAEKAKDLRPAAPIYTGLGEVYARSRRERRAEELWQKAILADPDFYPAQLRLAELSADRGLPAHAAAQLAALEAKQKPVTLKVLRAEANLALRRGRRAEAEALFARLSDAARDDADALHERFSFARARGQVDAALARLDEIMQKRPDLLSTALDRAELLDGIGRGEEAHRALEAALLTAPEDARLLERDGRLLHKLGREKDALPKLRRALELRPQNPELRAYLAELEARALPDKSKDPRTDLALRYSEDVRGIIDRARKKPKDASGAPARVLYDAAVTRVHVNGLSETFQQRVVEILDERGARAEGDFDIRYTPDTQSVEVRTSRVYKANGDILEAISTEETDQSEPWYGLYYDVRAQVVRFSSLSPGDVIDVEYVVSDVGRRNLFADYFGDLHFFQETVPRVESRWVLIAPKQKQLYFNTPRLANLEHTDEVIGDERIYSWKAHDVAKVDAEPGMPGYSELAAYVHVSTYKTWDDVALWYTGLVKPQLEPNAAIQRAVKDAIKGLKDERAKIRAVYDLVVKRTRYVGLEFGIHGYQPYKVAQVFARKFGDCKDKASLLVVMLKEAGIGASLVLARTRQGGDLDREPASLAPFDHAIAYVPKYDLYLDGTAEFSGADELPAQDQDIPVLQVNAGKLVRTPVLPPERNRVATTWRVALDASGAAIVDEQLGISGEAAHEWRQHYQSPGERNEKYEQAWNGKHPGAKIAALEMMLDDLEKPVEVHAGIEVPHWARPEGEGAQATLVLPALGREADMLRSYARLSSRKHDLVLGYPWRQEERVVVTLPPGYSPRRLPESRTAQAPFGTFQITVEAKAGQVVVTATLEVKRHRIAQADYAAFRSFCAEVDAAVAQNLVLGKDGPKEVSR